jgi:hypothetical protein
MTDGVRELNVDEVKAVSGAAQYPTSHPGGLPMPVPPS